MRARHLSEEQRIQENKYKFPYHYIPSLDNGNFSQSIAISWGYEYLSYIFFVLNKLSLIEFESLIDIGCGDGRFLYEASKLFPGKELIGVDISCRAIGYAKAVNPNGVYICGDITDGKLLRKKFDVITLIETLEHIPLDYIQAFVNSLHYYLKGDGFLVITVPTDNVRVNPKHYQHFGKESLCNTLKPLFTISEHYFINKISIWTKFLELLLDNRFFILKEWRLLNLIYRSYEKYLLNAEEDNARRICALCRRNRV